MNIFLKIKEKKEIIKDFLLFQSITVLLFFSFIWKHFSVDTYFLFFSNTDSSHSVYNFVISSGRLIPGLLYLFFEKLNINVVENQVLIFLAGIFVFALSVQIFYSTALKVFKNQDKILIFILSNIFYLSIFIGGMLIFSTPFVLFHISILFLSLAFRFLVQQKLFVSIFFAVASLFVYQVWFPLFLVVFFVYRTLKLNKTVVSSLIWTAFLYVLGFGLNYLFIKVYANLFNSSPNNRAEVGLVSFVETLKLFRTMTHTTITVTFEHFSKYFFVKIVGIMLIFIAYSVLLVKQKFSKVKYLTVTFLSISMLIVLPLIPSLFGKNHWIGDRYVLATGSMIGVLYFLFLFLNSNKYIKTGVMLFGIFYFVFMMQALNNEALILKSVNKKDAYLAKKYIEIIKNYEKKTGIEIKNVQFAKDKNTKRCKLEKCRGNLTLSSFSVEWADLESLNYYNKTKFKEINDLNEKYCKDRDWDEFSRDQLIFEGNSVLICVY